MKKIIGRLQLLRDIVRRKLGIILFDKAPANKSSLKNVKHVVIIRWDAKLGDSYISSFFYREIRKLSNVRVSVITTPELKELYVNGFGVENVFTVNKRPKYKELKKVALQVSDADFVIHLTEFMKMKDLYFLSFLKSASVASMDGSIRKVNVNMKEQTNNLLFHDKYVYLLDLLSVPDVDDSYIIPCAKKYDNNRSNYDIIFNFFGSTEHKSISIERAIETLDAIYEHSSIFKFKVGLMSSPSTAAKAKSIISQTINTNVCFIENIHTIEDAINEIKLSNVVVSVDTAIVHLSIGLNKKLIAIYPYIKNTFNPWLPPKNKNTYILFSECSGVNVNVNRYSDKELLALLSE